MNNKDFLNYAYDNNLVPVAWFNVNYPAYAIKIKYKYPTSNPTDFRDRALLQLIGIGISYPTACALLMVDDPYQTILERFKSSEPGPQLVYFDKALNRLNLTPIGQLKVDNTDLTRDGVATSFVDGYTVEPFPIDVVKSLSENRYSPVDIKWNAGGLYPFDPDVDRGLARLTSRLNDSKDGKCQLRLRIPEKAMEASLSLLEQKWITNLSIGIFLKEGKVIRRIFCDRSLEPISPFGWLQNLDGYKLTANEKNEKFSYIKVNPELTDAFSQSKEAAVGKLVESALVSDFEPEIINQSEIKFNPKTGLATLLVKNIDRITHNRTKLLSIIEKGLMPIQLKGLVGALFIEVKADESVNFLVSLRREIEKSESDWHQIITNIQKQYPGIWRQILIDIDRHDLLFRYDVEHFIHYGK